jgi:hypothetical protein
MEKTRSTKLISILLACVFVAGAAVGLYFALRKPNPSPDNPTGQPVAIVNTVTQNESFNDADAFIDFSLTVADGANISAQSISISNQNGDVPAVSLSRTSESEYILKAPATGYRPGDTYKIKILDKNVSFSDETIGERRDVTFSIFKQDISNIKTNASVKDIASNQIYSVSDSGYIAIGNEILIENGIEIGSVIILPVYDEYGFTTEIAYKVADVVAGGIIVEKPKSEEIFDDLEVKGVFDAVYAKEYFHIDEESLGEEIMRTSSMRALAAASESKKEPNIKLSVELKNGGVVVKYTVTFPEIYKKIDFTVTGELEIRLGARADVSLLNGTFNIGGIVSYTNKYKFKLGVSWKPTGSGGAELCKEAMEKLSEILAEKTAKQNHVARLFQTFLPTPIPGLGFVFDVKIVFKLEFKIELEVVFTDEFSLEVGVKKDSDGINPYFNKASKRDAAEIELRGSIEAKLGLEVKFGGSVLGILNAGVSFEIGVYAKVAGFVKAKAMSDLTLENFKPSADPYAAFCYGFYFETGVYSTLSLYAEVDFKIKTFEAKATLLEVKLPIFSIGLTQRFELIVENANLVLNESGKASLPNVTVRTLDMFSGETKDKTVLAKDLKDSFDLNYASVNFIINNSNEVQLTNLGIQEFDESIELKLRAWQSFAPKIELDVGLTGGSLSITGKRGIYHYELGALFVSEKISVNKKPVAPQSLSLSYERIVSDPEYAALHPNFSETELRYNIREDVDGIKDFQIGRLVKVTPSFYPQNTSYKRLSYSVVSGAQYIVGGTAGIRTYEEGGVTYAVFRIIDNDFAVGNVDGVLDYLKEIKIAATTTGYTGDYASMNIVSTAQGGIYASGVPTISYELSPVVDGNKIAQTAVRPGDEIVFDILPDSVFPRNATRGTAGQESLMLLSGSATVVSANGQGELDKIRINDNAQVGDQIVILSSLSGIERYYYLNVVKKAVEAISLSGGSLSVLPDDGRTIVADITGEDGKNPTIIEAFFLITRGSDLARITIDAVDKNKAYLDIYPIARNGDVIEVLAFIDGQRSNSLAYTVVKTDVQAVTLTNPHSLTVVKGDIIELSASVLPLGATFNIPKFVIVSGSQYAVIDAQSGRLIIKHAARGGETISVRAEADGIYSDTVIFTVAETPVKSIQFVNSDLFEYVRANQTIELDAFVNADATEQGVGYSFETGASYGSISGNSLTINAGLSPYTTIRIKASAIGDSSIFITKTFSIVSDLWAVSVNGKFDAVKILATDTPFVTVTDSSGDVLDNALVAFRVENQFGGATTLLTVTSAGQLIPNGNISSSVTDFFVMVYAVYGVDEIFITVEIVLLPQLVEIVLKSDMTTAEAGLKPNETAELALRVTAQNNAAPLTDISLQTTGNADAYLNVSIGDFQNKVYAIILQVRDNAVTGDTITVTARYIIDGGYIVSLPFTVTVLRLVESIEITNAPAALNIGESVTLEYLTNPEIRHANARFAFADSMYASRATLNGESGLLTINDNAALIGYGVKVVVTIDGVSSIEYEIQIKDVVREITIGSSYESKGVQYIAEMNFYVLYPNGEFVISKTTVGGGINPNVTYALDVAGQRYLDIAGNKITVKNTAINSGINATVIATVDGAVSNMLVIYIPSVIRTTDDWFAIRNNINGYYMLGDDIDFAGVEYQPIRMFAGIIDGAGFALKNITVDSISENNNAGLIEENYGIIVNLMVRQFSLNLTQAPEYGGTVYIGVFAARNFGYIINCKTVSTGMNLMYILIADSYSSGIAGLNAGNIRLCENWIYIQTAGKVGGIAGKNINGGEITDCFNAELLSANSYDKTIAVLGIVGEFVSGLVENNHNYGKVFDMSKWEYVE